MKHTDTQHKTNKDKVFIKKILAHYSDYGRHDLPWRKRITPYRVLVSEIMLQQTQVNRVIPKFKSWMNKYPTLTSLSKASFVDVLIRWQGLGYQRRAKALHSIAKDVKIIPNTYIKLLGLNSIGPYTASAIMAFAYDIFPERLLETNIRTALIEEFHQGETSIHDGLLYDDLFRLSKHVEVQSVGARIWYYALMDYGANLKSQDISHNMKSAHYSRQSPYSGSFRQLRAKVLFSVAHNCDLPSDTRTQDVIEKLLAEGYLTKKKNGYAIA